MEGLKAVSQMLFLGLICGLTFHNPNAHNEQSPPSVGYWELDSSGSVMGHHQVPGSVWCALGFWSLFLEAGVLPLFFKSFRRAPKIIFRLWVIINLRLVKKQHMLT